MNNATQIVIEALGGREVNRCSECRRWETVESAKEVAHASHCSLRGSTAPSGRKAKLAASLANQAAWYRQFDATSAADRISTAQQIAAGTLEDCDK